METGKNDAGTVPQAKEDSSKSFEELIEELDLIVERLAAGDIGIETAADLYQRGERLHALASARLDQVRERLQGMVTTQDD